MTESDVLKSHTRTTREIVRMPSQPMKKLVRLSNTREITQKDMRSSDQEKEEIMRAKWLSSEGCGVLANQLEKTYCKIIDEKFCLGQCNKAHGREQRMIKKVVGVLRKNEEKT